jgi:hypothetical protein
MDRPKAIKNTVWVFFRLYKKIIPLLLYALVNNEFFCVKNCQDILRIYQINSL